MGFAIFDRIGKSIRLTPAGKELISSLSRISQEIQFAIEQAQNMGERYRSAIKIGFPMRTMLTHLPEAIPIFEAEQPTVQIVPEMQPTIDAISSFMRRDLDIMLLLSKRLRNSMVLLLRRYLPVTSICYVKQLIHWPKKSVSR